MNSYIHQLRILPNRSPLFGVIRLAVTAALMMIASAQFTEVRAQTIVAIVNGEAITNNDIEQRIKLHKLTKQVTLTRQEALEELIGDKVKIREGRKFGLEMSAGDLEEQFTGTATRMRMTSDQLSKVLEQQGIRPDAFKARMKADMVWSNLVRGRFGKSFEVNDRDLQTQLGNSADATKVESFEYQVRPVILIVPRGAPASATDTRRKEAELLRTRIDSCDQAVRTLRSMRDSTIRESVTKSSSDLAAPLREILDKTPIGKLTPPEVTKQGVEMVALCDRKPTKIDSPAKRQLKDKVYSDRYEAKSKAYLQEARKSTMIEMR